MEEITDEMKLEALKEAMYKIIEDAKEEKSKSLLEVEQVYKEKDEIASLKNGQLAKTTRDIMANIQRESDAYNKEKELEEKYKSNVIKGEKLDKEKILKIIEEEFELKKQAVIKDEEKIDKAFENRKKALEEFEKLNKNKDELTQEEAKIEDELKKEGYSAQLKSDTRKVIAGIQEQSDKFDRKHVIEQKLKDIKKKISTEKGKITNADKKIKGFLEKYNIDLEKIKLEAEKPIAEEPVVEEPVAEEQPKEQTERPIIEESALEEKPTNEAEVSVDVEIKDSKEAQAEEQDKDEAEVKEEKRDTQPKVTNNKTTKSTLYTVKKDYKGVTINGKFISNSRINAIKQEIIKKQEKELENRLDNDIIYAGLALSKTSNEFSIKDFSEEYKKLQNMVKDDNGELLSTIKLTYDLKFRFKNLFANMRTKANIYDLKEKAYEVWKNDQAKIEAGPLTKLRFALKANKEKMSRKPLNKGDENNIEQSDNIPAVDEKTKNTIKDVVLGEQQKEAYWKNLEAYYDRELGPKDNKPMENSVEEKEHE